MGKGGDIQPAERDELETFDVETSTTRCHQCENNCLLTINKFADGSRLITGNRCEKGAGKTEKTTDLPNLYQYKLKRLFDYEACSAEEAPRGDHRDPASAEYVRELSVLAHLLDGAGIQGGAVAAVEKSIYEMGMDTISSDTACYPAKLVHGHIKSLIRDGHKLIFYPSINYERVEDQKQPNHYNCPIVATYPEVIANNMDEIIEEEGVTFLHPFLPYDDDKRLKKELYADLKDKGITISEKSQGSQRGAPGRGQIP